MPTVRSLSRFLFLSAINHQITIIVVESLLFKGFREAVSRRSYYLGQLVSCHLCFGAWVGFVLAIIFRPRFIDTTIGSSSSLPTKIATWLGDSFVIALGGRVFNELLGLLRREVSVREEESEVLEERRELLERRIDAISVQSTPGSGSSAIH